MKINNKEDVYVNLKPQEPKEGKFWARVLIVGGWVMLTLLMILLLVKAPIPLMKLIGAGGSIISIYLGYKEIVRINNKSKNN